MYQTDNAVITTINTVNVWEKVVNFSAGILRGVTFASDELTVPLDGQHEAIVSGLSASSASANKDFEVAIAVNDVIVGKSKAKRRYANADVGNSSAGALLQLTAGDTVALYVRCLTDTTDILIVDCNLQIHRL
jgi:hypothetical protein